MYLGSQFVQLKIHGETVKVGFRLEKNVFYNKDEGSYYTDFTIEKSETDRDNSTEDLKNKKC